MMTEQTTASGWAERRHSSWLSGWRVQLRGSQVMRRNCLLEQSVEERNEREFICQVPSHLLFPIDQTLPHVEWIPTHFRATSFGPLWEFFIRPMPFGVVLCLSLEVVGGTRHAMSIWSASGGLQGSDGQDRAISWGARLHQKNPRKQVKSGESEEAPEMYPTHCTSWIPQIPQTLPLYPLPDHNMRHAVIFWEQDALTSPI